MNRRSSIIVSAVVLLSLIFQSCGKVENVNGIVVNEYDGKPIEDISVLVKCENQNVMKSDPPATIDRARSAWDGKFTLDYRVRERKWFGYTAVVDLPKLDDSTGAVIDTFSKELKAYHCYERIHLNGGSYTAGSKNIEFKLKPLARVKILSWNATPYDERDRLNIFTYDLKGDSSSIHYATGRAIHVFKYYFIASRGKLPIKCYVTKNGITKCIKKDTIVAPAFQKATYYIDF